MTTDQEVAQELCKDAMQADKQTTAHLMIELAYKLDNDIDVNSIKTAWLEKWLEDNKNRSRDNG